jgi:hypothetical protein
MQMGGWGGTYLSDGSSRRTRVQGSSRERVARVDPACRLVALLQGGCRCGSRSSNLGHIRAFGGDGDEGGTRR